MTLQQKKRICQKLWGWICLSVNCLIMTIFLAREVSDFLAYGILLSVMILCYGIIKTQADKTKCDFSGASVVIEYICVYVITFLSACKVSEHLESLSLFIALAVAAISELLVFLLITYWYTIRRFFQAKRSAHGKF